MSLSQFTQEDVPPCFKVWCGHTDTEDPSFCGWKGKAVTGSFCTIGVNTLAQLVPDCPKCKRKKIFKLIDRASLTARWRWIVERPGLVVRDTEWFPCTCSHRPPCKPIGEAEIRESTLCDTTFVTNEAWVSVCGNVKCTGCYAMGRVSMIEKISYGQRPHLQDWSAYYRPEVK